MGLHGRGRLGCGLQGLQGELDGGVGLRLGDYGIACRGDDTNLLTHALPHAGHEDGHGGDDPQHGDERHATRRAAGRQRRPPMVKRLPAGSVGASAAMRTTRGGHSPAAACNCSSTAPGKASRERTSGTGHSGTHWPLRSSR